MSDPTLDRALAQVWNQRRSAQGALATLVDLYKKNNSTTNVQTDPDLALSYIKSSSFKIESNINDPETLNITSALILNYIQTPDSYDEELIVKILTAIDENFTNTTKLDQALDLLWRRCVVGSSSVDLQHLLLTKFPSFLSKQLETMTNNADSQDPSLISYSDGLTDLVILCKRDSTGKTFQELAFLINKKYKKCKTDRDLKIIQNLNRILIKELQSQCPKKEFIELFPMHLRQFVQMFLHSNESIREMGVKLFGSQIDDLDDKIILKIGFPEMLKNMNQI